MLSPCIITTIRPPLSIGVGVRRDSWQRFPVLYITRASIIWEATVLWRMRLSLGYSLDPKLLRRIGVASLSINLNASNLFCLTNYSGADPEVGYGGMGVATDGAKTPRSRQFTARVQIGF